MFRYEYETVTYKRDTTRDRLGAPRRRRELPGGTGLPEARLPQQDPLHGRQHRQRRARGPRLRGAFRPHPGRPHRRRPRRPRRRARPRPGRPDHVDVVYRKTGKVVTRYELGLRRRPALRQDPPAVRHPDRLQRPVRLPRNRSQAHVQPTSTTSPPPGADSTRRQVGDRQPTRAGGGTAAYINQKLSGLGASDDRCRRRQDLRRLQPRRPGEDRLGRRLLRDERHDQPTRSSSSWTSTATRCPTRSTARCVSAPAPRRDPVPAQHEPPHGVAHRRPHVRADAHPHRLLRPAGPAHHRHPGRHRGVLRRLRRLQRRRAVELGRQLLHRRER